MNDKTHSMQARNNASIHQPISLDIWRKGYGEKDMLTAVIIHKHYTANNMKYVIWSNMYLSAFPINNNKGQEYAVGIKNSPMNAVIKCLLRIAKLQQVINEAHPIEFRVSEIFFKKMEFVLKR